MFAIGLDIGSTSAKTVVLADRERSKQVLVYQSVMPTGWSSVETARAIRDQLVEAGIDVANARIIATGYGRVSVPFAHKTLTEITCHAKGAAWLFPRDCTVLDIGGQDTKVIVLKNGSVSDFLMNDKCSAGTGRFLEIMANSLGVTLEQLFTLASNGSGTSINSTCTVFAESEVISMIGSGRSKEDIAYGIVESITNKVVSLCSKKTGNTEYFLTGGLCDSDYVLRSLSVKLKAPVHSAPLARWAGAIGAALHASELQ